MQPPSFVCVASASSAAIVSLACSLFSRRRASRALVICLRLLPTVLPPPPTPTPSLVPDPGTDGVAPCSASSCASLRRLWHQNAHPSELGPATEPGHISVPP
ncbi:hypothetical protein FB639_003810 [Coemansia asiatica]|nr:hypothetical protein FB639_003810 [Coemansia asiatica]